MRAAGPVGSVASLVASETNLVFFLGRAGIICPEGPCVSGNRKKPEMTNQQIFIKKKLKDQKDWILV